MPVMIDEVIAEIAPPEAPGRGEERGRNQRPDAIKQARQLQELLERMERREARTRAD